MVVFPEVPKRAQEEIEAVVSPNRLPTMDDEPNLQYIRACVKETLRWMPTAALGAVPHATTNEDEYMGYQIPKGAGVVINTYTIHMDPKRYPGPRRFNSDRYKDDRQNAAEAASNPNVSQRDHFGFGAGRRVCPCLHVAERSLFLGMSNLLWAFKFEPEVDANGKPIIPDIERLTQGFASMPEPYQARIRPRSKERAELVEKAWEDTKKMLDPVTKQWKAIPEGMTLPSR